MILKPIFSLFICIYYFSLNIAFIILKIYQRVDDIYLQRTVSQNVEMDPSFIFMEKKREDFHYFIMITFLDFIKWKPGPILKI